MGGCESGRFSAGCGWREFSVAVGGVSSQLAVRAAGSQLAVGGVRFQVAVRAAGSQLAVGGVSSQLAVRAAGSQLAVGGVSSRAAVRVAGSQLAQLAVGGVRFRVAVRAVSKHSPRSVMVHPPTTGKNPDNTHLLVQDCCMQILWKMLGPSWSHQRMSY